MLYRESYRGKVTFVRSELYIVLVIFTLPGYRIPGSYVVHQSQSCLQCVFIDNRSQQFLPTRSSSISHVRCQQTIALFPAEQYSLHHHVCPASPAGVSNDVLFCVS